MVSKANINKNIVTSWMHWDDMRRAIRGVYDRYKQRSK